MGMKDVKIEKITLNIGVGSSGENLENAKNLLQKLTGQKPVATLSRKRIPTWDIRKDLPIGVKVTIRGKKALDFLDKCLDSIERKIKKKSFDKNGNFSFGVREYIDLPGFKYDPSIGMFGFDVCVTLIKPGYRISKRKRKPRSIPNKQRVKKEESIDFAKKNLDIEVVD